MGLLTPLAVRIGAIPWLPRFLPQIMWFDKLLQRLTRGRFTVLDMAGLPNIMLTTTGRRSGKARDIPLLCVPEGEDILIAGSNFGGRREPIWVKNIEATPEVTVRFDEEMSARVVHRLEGDERAAAWQHMLKTWPNFARYERRTDREIKVFRLTSSGDALG